jgi:pimeloyl-ACP methyl ester carboxylesterase
MATCLRIADGPGDAVISKFLPGMFTDAVSQEVREELSAITSEFHPIGFRLMSLSSAEVDTTDLLPNIDVATLVLGGDDDRRSPVQHRTAAPRGDTQCAVCQHLERRAREQQGATRCVL